MCSSIPGGRSWRIVLGLVNCAVPKEARCDVAAVISGRYVGINMRGVVARELCGEVIHRVYAVEK